MTLPTWFRPRRMTGKVNLVSRRAKRRKVFPARFTLELLEDRTLPATVTILGSHLLTAGGVPEYVRVFETGALTAGNDLTFNTSPGVYHLDTYADEATYGSFTVASDGTISGTTGALLASGSTIDFDLTKLAPVAISPPVTSSGRTQAALVGDVTANNDTRGSDTAYVPAGTFNLTDWINAKSYGTLTVSDNGSGVLSVSNTTGAAVATGNTITFDTTKLAAVTVAATDLRTAAGQQESWVLMGILQEGIAGTDTFYLPAGNYFVTDYFGAPAYGSFTVGANGSGALAVTGASGAAVATGNTIDFDLTKLAAITIVGTDVTTLAGNQQPVGINQVVGISGIDTVYLPAGTFDVSPYGGETIYGTITVGANASGTLVVTGTGGAAVATTPTRVDIEACELNQVQITANPGVRWDLFDFEGNGFRDRLALGDGSYTLGLHDPSGNFSTASFSVSASGLSATQLPAGNPLVTLRIVPCAPTLISAARVSNGTTIAGTYMGRANTTYQIKFYGDSTASPSGTGLGETLLGSASVVSDASGNASFTATVASLPAGEMLLSATATDPNGNVSDFSQVICLPPSALGTVYTVYNTADSGPGSLRQAILSADAGAGGTAAAPDEIAFCISPTDPGYNSTTGAFTIQPLSALTTITDTVVLNAASQPGYAGKPVIVLDGTYAGNGVNGLVLTAFAAGSTVQGFAIDHFIGNGIEVDGGGNNVLASNYIGVDATGNHAAGNAEDGIVLNNSSNNRVGGATTGAGNVISGNKGDGIDITGSGTSGNVVDSNYIGTDLSGTVALANQGDGVNIAGGASSNTIGGSSSVNFSASMLTGAGNVISGNGESGVLITGSGTSSNVVAGNFIGTDITGTRSISNNPTGNFTADAIDIVNGASGNQIGGASSVDAHGSLSGLGNLISGQNSSGPDSGVVGIYISGATSTNNLVEGNFIGTDVTGEHGLANVDGIDIADASDNTIGGTSLGTGNLISGNGVGIFLHGSSATGNLVEGNLIGTDATGKIALGNATAGFANSYLGFPNEGGSGVYIDRGANGNTIGGVARGAGNVMSGNGNDGIVLSDGGTNGNLVEGNYIGNNANGAKLGNTGDGVLVQYSASDNTIGGTAGGARNTIAFNDGLGVHVDGGAGNSILSNSIFSNGGGGIFLNSANNANDNQATPVLTGGTTSASGTSISGTLTSGANTIFRIEFFANQGLDPSGNAEGQTFLGFTTVTTNGSGNATFTATNLVAIPAGEGYVTATATNETTGDTSQFSNYLAVPTSMVLTASANPSFFGQPLTLTATVSPNFAGFGTPTGSVTFVDTTTNTPLGSVPLAGGVAALTTTALNTGTHVITATYAGNTIFLGSSATLTETLVPSILVLNPTASGALSLSGNASINVPGNVVVDSSSTTALTENGNASVTATSIQVVGGVSLTGTATLSPAPMTGAANVADPLAGLAGPSTTGLTNYGSVNLSGKNTPTLSPGIYSQISASGYAALTLNPGVYILEGGGFAVTGNASITATSVMIYNTGSNYPNAGGSYGGITLSGNGSFSLTAAGSGPYAGVLIFQSRANTRALAFSGNAVTGITGTIYAPSAQVLVSGNARLTGSLVANQLSLGGNGVSTQVADGSAGSVLDAASAGTLLAGNLDVYVNDPSSYFTTNEQARIQDAINAWDNRLAPYNVVITEVSDPTLANVVIDTGTTSAAGTAAGGVLGSYSSTGEITILQGWNWYDGSDPTQIGAGQYDFQTVVTHELGHALGLGGSADPNSPMFEILAPGVVRRTPTAADLNIPEAPSGADAERAAVPSSNQSLTQMITAGQDAAESIRLSSSAVFAESAHGQWPSIPMLSTLDWARAAEGQGFLGQPRVGAAAQAVLIRNSLPAVAANLGDMPAVGAACQDGLPGGFGWDSGNHADAPAIADMRRHMPPDTAPVRIHERLPSENTAGYRTRGVATGPTPGQKATAQRLQLVDLLFAGLCAALAATPREQDERMPAMPAEA